MPLAPEVRRHPDRQGDSHQWNAYSEEQFQSRHSCLPVAHACAGGVVELPNPTTEEGLFVSISP